MTISALPEVPLVSDLPSEFNIKAFAWVAALPTFGSEANDLATEVNGYAGAASDSAVAASGYSTAASDFADDSAASAATALAAPGTSATSTTSLTVGTGSKSLTIQTGKSIVVGMSVKIAYTTTPTTWMHGDVTAYNSGTGALTVNVTSTSGSGTQTAWTVSLSAPGVAYPGSGVPNSTGSAWGTSYSTSGSGTVLALATSPSLTTPDLGTPSAGNLVNCTADGTEEVGYRTVPQEIQSAVYTLRWQDSGCHILHPSADTTARTWTIPANSATAYPIGTALTFVNQNGGGVITIAITTDTMRLAGAGTTGSRTLAANGVATALKLTSTEWIISGTGLT